MEYKEIFEEIRVIVAKKSGVDKTGVDLEFELFRVEYFDKRRGLKSYEPVTNFKVEECQYYGRRLIFGGDTLDALELLTALEYEFDI